MSARAWRERRAKAWSIDRVGRPVIVDEMQDGGYWVWPEARWKKGDGRQRRVANQLRRQRRKHPIVIKKYGWVIEGGTAQSREFVAARLTRARVAEMDREIVAMMTELNLYGSVSIPGLRNRQLINARPISFWARAMPWDHPDADPLADMRAAFEAGFRQPTYPNTTPESFVRSSIFGLSRKPTED